MTIDTSVDAYIKIKESLPKRQAQVYNAILKRPNRTSAEIAKSLLLPLRSVAPRITEMLQDRRIKRGNRRTCFVTGGGAYTLMVI